VAGAIVRGVALEGALGESQRDREPVGGEEPVSGGPVGAVSWALWKEPEDDHAVAISDHGDTPDKINDLRMPGQPRLNGKLR